jgi:putative nucleotidyltransferase with HDIG domain
MPALLAGPPARASAIGAGSVAGQLLQRARERERAGLVAEAARGYDAAVAEAERTGDQPILARALRHRAVLHHRANEPGDARRLCQRSYEVATALGDRALAAEAMNTLGGLELEAGAGRAAREAFQRALDLGGDWPELRARVEQNLGILANIRGELIAAVGHYSRSLEAYRRIGSDEGCARAYHNLGMVRADQKQWAEADRHFREGLHTARRLGDVHLEGLCRLNHAEVHLALGRIEVARSEAESALRIFDELGDGLDLADAFRVLGTVLHRAGRLALAESRLRTAVELAASTGAPLNEAEASRELAALYTDTGRGREALSLLTAAYRLFSQVEARNDLFEVAARLTDLEERYVAIVREGHPEEAADAGTLGHSERVAGYALQVADALRLPAARRSTLRVGAYLHDLGKARVPREILDKPGPLTDDEFAVIRQHPVWGLELYAGIESPWNVTPIIRWHHEKYDGTGYPDGLAGDAIPVEAQVVCIADVYDALTSSRSYRAALEPARALEVVAGSRRWWSPAVFDAFMGSVGGHVAAVN